MIRYKKGIYNKVVDMLSRPIVSASIILKHNPIMHESYVEQYALDIDFKDMYATLCQTNEVEELDYHVHANLLYHLSKLCIPQGERVRRTFFSCCWTFRCRKDGGKFAKVLLLA